MKSIYLDIAIQVRKEIVNKYDEDFLNGKCIEASERIVQILSENNIKASTVEGWVQYDDATGCSDRDYDEHTWVETEDGYIIDVTATQFNYYMDEDYPEVIVTKSLPHGYSYDEPDSYIDDCSDEEWSYKSLIGAKGNYKLQENSNQEKSEIYYRFEVFDHNSRKISGGLFRGLNKFLEKLYREDDPTYEDLNYWVAHLEYVTPFPKNFDNNKAKFAYKKSFINKYKDHFDKISELLDELDWELLDTKVQVKPYDIVYEDDTQIAYTKGVSLTEAKKKRKKKKQKPSFGWWSTFNPNAGNVEYNNAFFNHVMGNTSTSEFSDANASAEMGGDCGGMGESYLKNKQVKINLNEQKDTFIQDYILYMSNNGFEVNVNEVYKLWESANKFGFYDYKTYISRKTLLESTEGSKLVWYDLPSSGSYPAKDFLRNVGQPISGYMSRLIYKLEHGIPFTSGQSEYLGNGIYELRLAKQDTWYRLTYFYPGDGTFVVLSGFQKKSNKTPTNELDIAIKRKKEYLSRGGNK